jgi:uncharacterized protein (TIGR02271 family)
MQNTNRSTIVGVFHERRQAERAIEELHRAGFTDEQIGFVMRDGDGRTDVEHVEGESHAGGGAVGGMLAGAGIGGLAAAAASLLIPGFGPVIAAGLFATILGGAAVGAAAGGILGALIGAGVPEEEAHYYEGEFNEGRAIVTVRADGRAAEAEDILSEYGAYDMQRPQGMRATSAGAMREHDSTTRPMAGTRMEGTDRMTLHEEELHATTRPVEAGEVRVTKEVVSEQKSIDVPVSREEVYVERHPVDRPAGDKDFRDQEIRVPVSREEIEVEKTARVREEIEVGKREVEETQRVGGTVRREEARIDRTGDVNVHGWDNVASNFRQRWQSRYGTSGGRFEDYEPGYRYGYEMSNDPRYKGREWTDVEPDLRSNYGTWGQKYGYRSGDNDWDRFRDSVHDAWDEGRSSSRRAA